MTEQPQTSPAEDGEAAAAARRLVGEQDYVEDAHQAELMAYSEQESRDYADTLTEIADQPGRSDREIDGLQIQAEKVLETADRRAEFVADSYAVVKAFIERTRDAVPEGEAVRAEIEAELQKALEETGFVGEVQTSDAVSFIENPHAQAAASLAANWMREHGSAEELGKLTDGYREDLK